MIISHSKSFVFAHIPKTGGTSVNHVLMPYRPWRERFLVGRAVRRLTKRYSFSGHTHAPLVAAREILGRQKFDGMLKFSVVRHPVDWHHSVYRWILKYRGKRLLAPVYRDSGKIKSFADYIHWRIDHGQFLQITSLVDEEGALLVERICRFENLNSDANGIFRDIGIDTTLPKLNVNPVKRTSPGPKEVALIEQHFTEDFQAFGYTGDGSEKNWTLDRSLKFPAAGRLLKAHGGAHFDPWTV